MRLKEAVFNTDCENYFFIVRERNAEPGGRKFGRWQRRRNTVKSDRWGVRSVNEC